jgi:hypothetical protein
MTRWGIQLAGMMVMDGWRRCCAAGPILEFVDVCAGVELSFIVRTCPLVAD